MFFNNLRHTIKNCFNATISADNSDFIKVSLNVKQRLISIKKDKGINISFLAWKKKTFK